MIADSHILASDLIFVMQRRIGYRYAADEYGRKSRHRSQHPGTPDLHADIENLGDFLLRRKLVRHCKTRGARCETEACLAAQIVNLVDHAVDFIRQREALFAYCAIVLQQALHTFDHFALARHRQMQRLQMIELVAVRIEWNLALDRPQSIVEESQPPRGSDTRIELAQRACGRVARIDERLFS